MKTDWKTFQLEMIKYGVAAAVIFEIVSLPILGFSVQFAYGLALGTAVAVVNFRIQAFTCERVLYSRSGMLAAFSFPIRMLIYGGVFLVCIRTAGASAVGAACGFMTLPCGTFYAHVIKRRKRRELNG